MHSNIAESLRPLATPIGDLKPDPRNARTHPEHNVQAIASSLDLFGQRKPIVVRRDGMVVLAGNGTLEAAQRLGWTHVAAVLVDDDPITATAYSLADNQTGLSSEWDDARLSELLREVSDSVPLTSLGFTDAELETLLAEAAAVSNATGPSSTGTRPGEPASQGVPAFAPTSGDDQHHLDRVPPKPCPHCGKDTRQPPEASE